MACVLFAVSFDDKNEHFFLFYILLGLFFRSACDFCSIEDPKDHASSPPRTSSFPPSAKRSFSYSWSRPFLVVLGCYDSPVPMTTTLG
jgi:hypothetical protein